MLASCESKRFFPGIRHISCVYALAGEAARDRAGYLYPAGDNAAAAQIARRLVEDTELRKRMGVDARTEVGIRSK